LIALALCLAAAATPWVVVHDDTVPVSDRDLWTSEIPDLVVDVDGVPWIGFTRRLGDDASVSAGVAHRSFTGWMVEPHLMPGSKSVVLAVDGSDVVAFGRSAVESVVMRHHDGIWSPEVSIPGSVFAASSGTVAWGVKDNHWTQFDREEARWTATSLAVQWGNAIHQEAISADGVACFVPNQGVVVVDRTRVEPVFATENWPVVRSMRTPAGTVVASQKQEGGWPSPHPIVLHERQSTGAWSERTVASVRVQAPICPPTQAECVTELRRFVLLGLAPTGEVLVSEQVATAHFAKTCARWGPQPPTPGDMPIARDCLEHTDQWGPTYATGEMQSQTLQLDDALLAIADGPPTDDVVLDEHDGVIHLAWYVEGPTGVAVRYVAVRRE
jgi:hypothetical protein